MSRFTVFTIFFTSFLFNAGCACDDYRAVPSGYTAKLLTPTGFQDKLYTSGQVNIGTLDNDKQGNVLILVENTSITVKESFLGSHANPDKEDHRIVLEDMIPLSVDVRISFMTPDFSHKDSDKLFTLITPEKLNANDDRVQVIRLEKIYDMLGKMGVRSTIRKVFDEHGKNYKNVLINRTKINDILSKEIIKELSESGIPLRAKAVDISMIMPDENIWRTNAEISAAEAKVLNMRKLAEEINKLPNGLEIYRLLMMKEMVELSAGKGGNTLIIPIPGDLLNKVVPRE